jgi:hypothetical protein
MSTNSATSQQALQWNKFTAQVLRRGKEGDYGMPRIPALLLSMCMVPTSCSCAAQTLNEAYEHGTCIIVAWHDNEIALASDSRYVITIPSTDGVEKQSIGPDQCKIRQPSQQLLIAIEGIGGIFPRSGEGRRWDALDTATHLFGGKATLTTGELLERASQWQKTFIECDQAGMVELSIPDSGLPNLHIIAYSNTGTVVISARFTRDKGLIIPVPPYLIPPGALHTTKVIRYGSCNSYLGKNQPRSDLTDEERERYSTLSGKSEPEAQSGSSLAKLASDYVTLASDIEGRLATDERPAKVAPPIFSSFFDTSSGRLKTPQPGVCAQFVIP